MNTEYLGIDGEENTPYYLKIATLEDLDTVVNTLLKFKQETQHKEDSEDLSKIRDTFSYVLSKNKEEDIIILCLIQDTCIGILYGSCNTLPHNNTDLIAAEKIWWVDKEYRSTGIGKQLYEAFEFWANKLGAKYTMTGDPTGQLEQFYTNKGYSPVERIYIKQWPKHS